MASPGQTSGPKPTPWPPLTLPFVDLFSGSVAGAAQVIVGQPLDTIKTRAQTAARGQFKGPTDILVQTVRREGVLALYKGMASPLMGIALQNSLLFTAFQLSRRAVSPETSDLTTRQTVLAGAMAGAANSVMASPVELFKIRMQAQYGSATDKKLRQVARDLWAEAGFRRGVMRGFWITVLRETPAYAGFYGGFTKSKELFQRKLYPNEAQLPIWCLMASGSVGGICNWLACYPLDVVKSRVQLTSRKLGPAYILDEFRAVVHEGGYAALVRGLSPTLLRAIPAAAATFTAFELTKDALEGRR
ncbi:mitochondrial carrier [Acaromyces ingoldii]|uniref:Mitochondrial carrier n=1 Tax=Acaromyces ingoldii TaxID=215250 RepID=A0A316YJU1_9BASI|nr:mitochondrial carrier [Acaromyces ingoldii]PWN89820.1 mitochondrial carrier [Acaromyces ingoldii]